MIERVPNNVASNWANLSSQHFSPNYKHVFIGLNNCVGISYQAIREYGIPKRRAMLMILALLWLFIHHKPQHLITSRYALLQGYMRVGYSPQYIYYELLSKVTTVSDDTLDKYNIIVHSKNTTL